jgi:hypothetical protein
VEEKVSENDSDEENSDNAYSEEELDQVAEI